MCVTKRWEHERGTPAEQPTGLCDTTLFGRTPSVRRSTPTRPAALLERSRDEEMRICMRRLLVFLPLALAAGTWSAAASAGSVFGDFNGDGFADLAVGVPLEDVGTVANAGAVNVIYGSAAGLTAAGNQFWHENKGGIDDSAEPGDRFGSGLAGADFG